jgi:hypothetical protein
MSMVGNEGFVGNVLIPISRYEELLACESRLQVLMDLLASENTIKSTTLAVILGNAELAVQLEEDDRRFWEEFEKKNALSAGDDLKEVFRDED